MTDLPEEFDAELRRVEAELTRQIGEQTGNDDLQVHFDRSPLPFLLPPAADSDRWHLWGIEGCIHENDDPDQIRWNQEDCASCDCELAETDT